MLSQNYEKMMILQSILTSNTIVPVVFLSYLTAEDLLELTCVSKELNEQFEGNQIITNRIFYLRCLEFDRIMYVSYMKEDKGKPQQLIIMQNILNNSAFTELAKEKKNIFSLFNQNLEQLSVNIDSTEFIQTIQKSLSNPDFPLPRLRRQTIGNYCNTNYQLFLADVLQSNGIQDQYCQFQQLKKSLFENPETLISQFENQSKFALIKQIRYRPEAIKRFENQHPFLNLIQLLIMSVKIEVNAVYEHLVAMQQTLNSLDFFTEYCSRYQLFRNIIIDLEEKVGFLFTHFDQTFNYCYPQFTYLPKFSLWRIAMKMWVQKTQNFHDICNKICTILFLRQRQLETTGFIQQQLLKQQQGTPSSIKNSTNYQHLKSTKTSQKFQHEYGLNLPTLINNEDIGILLASYIQSIVDASMNQYNVHWCGSLDLKIQGPYETLQTLLLKSNQQYINDLIQIYLNPVTIRHIISNQINKIQNTIKPFTLDKIIFETNTILLHSFSSTQDYEAITNSIPIQLPNEIRINTSKINRLNERHILQMPSQQLTIFFSHSTLTNEQLDDILGEKNRKSNVMTMSTHNQTQNQMSQTSMRSQPKQLEGQELLGLKLSKSYSYV